MNLERQTDFKIMHGSKIGLLILMTASLALTACSIIGYNVDKRIDATHPSPSGTGRPSIAPQKAHANLFTTVGEEIDKDILKALTTRETQHDMAWRDVQYCLEEETRVCSISSGCRCVERK